MASSLARICVRPAFTQTLRAVGARASVSAFSSHAGFLPTFPQAKPLCKVGQTQNGVRFYSGQEPLNLQFIHDRFSLIIETFKIIKFSFRVMLVLNLFDKIDNAKLTAESHFINDLGLDSLDHVEIMLMIEVLTIFRNLQTLFIFFSRMSLVSRSPMTMVKDS